MRQLGTVGRGCRILFRFGIFEEFLICGKPVLLQGTPHSNGSANGKNAFKGIVLDVLVVDLLTCEIHLVAVALANNGMFLMTEVVQPQNPDVD